MAQRGDACLNQLELEMIKLWQAGKLVLLPKQ
jgi:hypothetical protein